MPAFLLDKLLAFSGILCFFEMIRNGTRWTDLTKKAPEGVDEVCNHIFHVRYYAFIIVHHLIHLHGHRHGVVYLYCSCVRTTCGLAFHLMYLFGTIIYLYFISDLIGLTALGLVQHISV